VIISDTNILSSFAAAEGLPLLFDILHFKTAKEIFAD